MSDEDLCWILFTCFFFCPRFMVLKEEYWFSFFLSLPYFSERNLFVWWRGNDIWIWFPFKSESVWYFVVFSWHLIKRRVYKWNIFFKTEFILSPHIHESLYTKLNCIVYVWNLTMCIFLLFYIVNLFFLFLLDDTLNISVFVWLTFDRRSPAHRWSFTSYKKNCVHHNEGAKDSVHDSTSKFFQLKYYDFCNLRQIVFF